MSDGLPRTPKEALATAVGLGVLTVQRLQVRRRQLQRDAAPDLASASRKLAQELRTQLPVYAGRLDEVAQVAADRLEPVFTELEARLPASGRELADQGRSLITGARRQLRTWASEGQTP